MESHILAKVRELLDVLEQLPGERGELPQILQHIAQTAQQFFFADASAILAMNPITGRIVDTQAIVGNAPQNKRKAQEYLKVGGLLGETLERGFLMVEDLQAQPEYHTQLTRAEGVRSFVGLALRMKYDQKPLGVLYLYYKQPRHFTTAELELLPFFANQASFLLQETWLLRRYRRVARIGQEINRDLSTIDVLFKKLVRYVPGILDARHAFFLATYQTQTNTLDLYMQEEGKQIYQANLPLDGACKQVIETHDMQFIRHMSQEAERLPFSLSPIPGTGPKESYIFVPLALREVPLGVLSIQHPEPDAFDQDDVLILQLLAIHISLACYNMRLLNRLSQLNETGQFLTEHLDPEQTLQGAVERIQAATRADVVILYRYDAGEQRFVHPPRVTGTLFDSDPRQMYPARSRDIVRLLLEREEPIFARQSTRVYSELRGEEESYERKFALREQISSTAAVPLRVKDEPVGILFVNFRHPQRFEESHRLLIEGLAHYAAIAIKNAHMYERLGERRQRELEILREVDRQLNRSLDLDPILDTLLRLGHEQVPAGAASILLYDRRKQTLTIQAAIGSHAEISHGQVYSLPESKGITHWVLDNKKPARVDNVHRDPAWRDIYIQIGPETTSELDVPLLDGEEVVGVLNFESAREAFFSEQDEAFLITLAGQAVLAIKNAQAYEQAIKERQRFQLWYQARQELDGVIDLAQLDQAYALIVRIAAEHSQSHAIIRRYDQDAEELVMTYSSRPGYIPLFPRTSLEAGISGQVAHEKRTIVVDDIENPPPGVALPQLSDTTARSLLITPITLNEQYYGNLALTHPEVAHFREADREFFEGLAQELAATIYRLETTQERQEYEEQLRASKIMSSLGQISFELTHHVGNDLGLVETYVDDIRQELAAQNAANPVVLKKLDTIVRMTRRVLDLSMTLKQALPREAEQVIVPARVLLEEALAQVSSPLPPGIYSELIIDNHAADVRVNYSAVADILRNLVTNALEAMPNGGKLTLKARNAGRFVALEVADTGVGIPTHQLAKIFDLSFSTKGSSGFGLWSAWKNALDNYGELKVESHVGQGTTFTLLLPRVEK